MRVRLWLIASSLIIASCGSEEYPEDDVGPFRFDASPVTTSDSGGSSGSDAGGSVDASVPNDAGSASDAGNPGMDAATPDGGAKDAGPAPDAMTVDAMMMGDATSDGASADGGADYAIAMLGAPCTTALDKACTGHNAADKLVCLDGKWAHNGSCDTEARCESQKGPSQGLCVNIATGCAGKMPGATVCDSNTVKTCSLDLTSLTTTTTCSANSHCEEGAPASCKCDTGYVAGSGGTCTNANDCADNPCGASGTGNTCTDALNDFTCTCGPNYWQRDTKSCISRFDRVAAGANRTCAIRRDRTVACWGEGTDGNSSTPVVIAGLTNVTQLAVGVDHACALHDGIVSCWGRNNDGQLGNGNNTDSLTTPVTVTVLNGNDVAQISAGDGFTCAVRAGNVLNNPRTYCWGDNSVGQLGINSTQASFNRPQQITASNSNYDMVVAGSRHACGRRENNNHSLYCWGANNHGQLGNNGTADRVNAPVAATGQASSNVDEITAGTDFTCVRKGGNVYCWGVPIGADGANVLTPTQVAGLTDAAQISAGAVGAHVCARKSGSNGNVVCWGSDADGQLGNGDGGSSVTPVAISGGVTSFRDVSAGSHHTCAVRSGNDSDILCWGEGSSGELGNGSRNDSPTPVVVVH